MNLSSCIVSHFLLISGVARIITPEPVEPISTQQLTIRLSSAIQSLRTLRCVVDTEERIGNSYTPGLTQMKLSFSPLSIYLKNQKNVEVLFVTGQNNNNAWVYPGSFPYVTLSLNPFGSLMRKGQHHTVIQAGFGTIADLIGSSSGQGGTAFTRSFRYAGDTLVQGRRAYILRSDYPQFQYIPYKVARNETVHSIANHFGCGEYRILERNDLAIESKLAEGRILQVPNSYGRRTILIINAKTYLPTSVTVHDDRGLYEKYTFLNVIPNQPISASEFTKEYHDYKL